MNQAEISKKGDILIVDDTPNNLRLLSTLLQRQGYEVRSVLNGLMALKAAHSAPPDLILLDISMPEMNGYEVCQHLKASKLTREIPVIFISAYNEAMDKVKAFEVGGVDYIAKPFQWAEVLARVENQLKICSLQKQLQAQNEQLQQEIKERRRAEAALQTANLKLRGLANLDGLTGTANRRRFDEYLRIQWQHLQQDQWPLSLILSDVDYFKRYNDTYGHLAGDHCLRTVVQKLEQVLKEQEEVICRSSLIARYGGEEFAAILPKVDCTLAWKIAQEIRQAVHSLQIPHSQSEVQPYVTVSLGVSTVIPHPGLNPNDLIAWTDQALYEAKARGRDQAIAHSDSP
ncbi:diguanylate cyclase [Spirulina sp. CS-785/01]|uniref:diguanylate cyclase domain-containing protein n=1 Tax=Spirulina sp. CS-785/01 TaxID=3021716 RepID=UPI00232B2BF8|nr:diguanylate cyclase [Spirulina sp. CS-785/01]MDB9314421.1 diguanylate cyclase [Spirulina sp. CS-785/01]